ncbi:MAG: efflux RND transporter permease subunit [Oscillospiraceae bacterium]|nr:efflux RND transporter permease subunit [Oscillospiraceae bacterium]
MKFIRSVVNNPTRIFLVLIAVIVFGSVSLASMPLEYFPDMDMPMELVMVTWGGADADSIESIVTEEIEDAVKSLSDVDSIISYTFDNYCMVGIQYNYGIDMDEAYMDLRSAMDTLSDDLPDDCGDPTIMEISMDMIATMYISVSYAEGSDGHTILENDLVPDLESTEGVAQVTLMGDSEEYFRLVLDEAAMNQYGLTISSLVSAIAAADFDMPLGDVSMGTQDIALTTSGNLELDSPQILSIPIQTATGAIVSLKDLTVYNGFDTEESDSVVRFNGEETILLSVTKQDSASTIDVCGAVDDVLDEYSAEGLDFEIISSEADTITDTLTQVVQTLIIGVVLTMIILLLFFGSLRASFIVAISMPLSILLAVMCLSLAGYSINLVTGTSLIIAIGMIVDNAIVIIESCMRYHDGGMDLKDAAVKGTTTMVMSVIAGTLTSVVVYLPLGLTSGMVGQMAGPLAWTIALTLLSSLICSVIIVPLLFVLMKPVSKDDIPMNRLMKRMRSGYRRIMPRFLRHPKTVVGAAVIILVIAFMIASQLEFVLFNSDYDGSITLDATFRSGTKVEVIDESIQELETALMEDEYFDRIMLQISDNTASFTAYAVDNCKRSSEEAVEFYTEQFGSTAGMDLTVSAYSSSSMSSMISSGNEVEVLLEGDDLDNLQEAASMVESVMRETGGVINVTNEFNTSQVKGELIIDAQKALAAGTSQASLAAQVYYMLNGVTAATIEYDSTEYDVVIEYPEGKYEDVSALMDQPLLTNSGKYITLSDVATIEYSTSLPSIYRQDDKFTVTLTATTTAASLYTAEDAINAAVDELSFPEGVAVAQSSLQSMQSDSISSMAQALATGIFLVFLVMALQFSSPRLSLMVMITIPFSLIGSFLFLFLIGEPLSVTGLMGFLMLMGITVNNGIYLVDGTNQLRQTMPLGEALVEAGTTRLRPILMTTLTTIISMIPMIFNNDSGMSMMKDMGYIIIGGLVASTLLAMFMLPPFYLLIRRENLDGTKRGRKGKKKSLPEPEPEQPAPQETTV